MFRRAIGILLWLVAGTVQASTGGVPADPNIFRYPVTIQFKDGDNFHTFCVGAQINPNTIMTAAHCLQPRPGAGKPLYVFRLWQGELLVSRVKELATNPSYGSTKFPAGDAYDMGMLKLQGNYPAGNLYYDPSFDPYTYLKRQLGQEILVDDFGFNPSKGIYTAKNLIMTGDKCLEQIIDLSTHEWDQLTPDEKGMLDALRLQLANQPQSLFCSFIKKTDAFQHELGDSGSPLVFNVNGKATLAGMLAGIVPLPSTRQYSMISIYVTTTNNKDFLNACSSSRLNTQQGLAMASAPGNSPCEYHSADGASAAAWMLLLLQ
jgi:hypothetical protein